MKLLYYGLLAICLVCLLAFVRQGHAQGGYVSVGAVVNDDTESGAGFNVSAGIPLDREMFNIYFDATFTDVTETIWKDDPEYPGNPNIKIPEKYSPISTTVHIGISPRLFGSKTYGVWLVAAPGVRNTNLGNTFNAALGGQIRKNFGHFDIQIMPIVELEKNDRVFFAPRFNVGYTF